jgi:uncharacterized iron-regulated membrane protein
MPTWGTMTVRLATQPTGPVSFTMTDATYWNSFARSQLTLDGASGEVVRWEPYTNTSLGQRARGWVRFGHTGELGGWPGQLIAGVACVGGGFLVWTGLALALRRLLAWRFVRKVSWRKTVAEDGAGCGRGLRSPRSSEPLSEAGLPVEDWRPLLGVTDEPGHSPQQ